MAKTGGLGDALYVGGYDLSGDALSVDQISGGPATLDVTPINASAHVRIGGLRDSAWSFTTAFDNAAGAEHPALKGLPAADVIACYLRGTTLQNAAAGIVAKQLDYDFTRDNTGMLTAKIDLQSNAYGYQWGENLTAGLRTDTAATIGSAITDLAATSFGGEAFFQVVSFTGTSVTIDIQSATSSGGSYSTTGLTSSAFNGIGAQRVATSVSTTIDEYLKVVTTGTFSNAVFAVVFVRNPAANQAF